MQRNGQKSRPLHKKILRLILILASVWILLAVLLFTFQASFVYHPSARQRGTPRDFGLAYEDVWFHTSDKVTLHGWHISAHSPIATMLYCHGNGGNISYGLEHLALLNKLGLEVFTFDYRGFGKSNGTPTEEGTYRDARAAWNYLVGDAKVPGKRIVVYGRSLGGAVAAWLASQMTPGALIVENAFISVPEAGQDIYPIFPSRLMAQFQYNTLEYIKNTHVPVLIIHAKDDRQIPFRHGKALFSAASMPKRFLEISGGHVDAYKGSAPAYAKEIKRFVNDFLGTSKGNNN
jgi:hypothetical protein